MASKLGGLSTDQRRYLHLSPEERIKEFKDSHRWSIRHVIKEKIKRWSVDVKIAYAYVSEAPKMDDFKELLEKMHKELGKIIEENNAKH